MAFKLGNKTRLGLTIGISFCFFVAEITVAFKTSSLALIADAFHYLNDLVGFIVALTAQIISEKRAARQDLSFGWQRARLLGAFFNGVFLLALGISILLQSIERFYKVETINDPELVMIIGCIGLALNVLSATVLHGHGGHDHSQGQNNQPDLEHNAEDKELVAQEPKHSSDSNARNHVRKHAAHRHNIIRPHRPSRDLGLLGVFVHVVGDAINNIGVIIAAVIIWQTNSPQRYYADPAASTFIAFMIFFGAIPLTKNSGKILMQSAPQGVEIGDVKHDIEEIPGIESVHELHIWRLDQQKAIASAHVVLSDPSMDSFLEKARTVSECLHAYGIHSATLQPEIALGQRQGGGEEAKSQSQAQQEQQQQQPYPVPSAAVSSESTGSGSGTGPASSSSTCQIVCSDSCQNLKCCN